MRGQPATFRDLRLRASLSAALALGICAAAAGQAPPIAPRKQSLYAPVFSTPPEAKPPRSLAYVFPFGPPATTAAVAFRPDGKWLAVGAYQELLVWDLANAQLLRRLGAGQIGEAIHALAFRNDNRLLAVGEGAPHGPGAVKLFDLQTGQLAANFAEPKDVTSCLAFSPDGKLLAAGGVDRVLRVWQVDERKLVTSLSEHGDWITGVSFSPDGKFLASSSLDKTALVWDTATWKRVSRLEESDPLQTLAFNGDGQLLALATAGVNDKFVRLRRRDNGDLARNFDLGTVVPLALVWQTQGNRLYLSCSDKSLRVYDAGNGNHLASLVGHAGWVYGAALSPDGARIASASADGTVKLWLAGEWRLLATLAQLTPRTDEWLIYTPPGYLATSSPGSVQWQANGVTTPADKLLGILHNADLVKQALAGGKVAAPAIP